MKNMKVMKTKAYKIKNLILHALHDYFAQLNIFTVYGAVGTR